MKVVPKDGKLYAEVTLRDVVERSDVSDMPVLTEVKRLYEENDKLRELVKEAHLCMVNEGCCEDCYTTCGNCPIESDMRELGIEVDE
ncbi:MAG: hypothetical protein IKE22_12395 [Atopobiaceae bacterium]|nr:hypothetical protein [Atopobiaceae bacterium]